MINLDKRIIKAIGANTFGQLITILVQIVGVPLLLHHWGITLYGEWLMLSSIPVYLSLSDVGFTKVAASEMTMMVAKKDFSAAIDTYQSVWGLISVLSIIIIFILLSISFLLFKTNFFVASMIDKSQAIIIINILAIYAVVCLQSGLLEAGFQCDGNYAQGLFFYNLIRLFEWLAVFVIVVYGGGPIHAAIALLLSRIMGTILEWRLLSKMSPWLKHGIGKANLITIKRLLKPAFAFVTFPISNAMSIQGMVVIIGTVIGPQAVVIFTTCRTLSRVAVQAVSIISSSIWPQISIAYANGRIVEIRTLYSKISNITFWVALVIVSLLASFGHFILSIWTHNSVNPKLLFFLLILLVTFINAIWQTSWVIIIATNQHVKVSFIFLVTTILSLCFSIGLMRWLNINGAAIAILVIDIVMLICSVKKALRIANINIKSFLLQLKPFAYQN